MALMDQANKKATSDFQKPDVAQFIPAEMKDTVERITAAGIKFMYAPQTRQQVSEAIQAEGPVAQKLADNVAGLMLTLDQKAKGGIPVGALFPAGMELLGEAAEMLSASGQAVTQTDFNEAAQLLLITMSRKLGASDEQIMSAAQGMVGGESAEGEAPPEAEPEAIPEEAMPEEMP